MRTGVVGLEEPGGRLGRAHKGRGARGVGDGLYPCAAELGYHRGHSRGPHLGQGEIIQGEKRGKGRPQLVGGHRTIRGHAPHGSESLTVVGPDNGMGIPYVNSK